MKFTIKADFIFEAENISDAFQRLASYFECIGTSKEFTLSEGGKIDIKPLKTDEHE